MKYIVIFMMLITSLSLHAGGISAVFGEGVFGTKWGDNIEDVKKVFPSGKIEKFGDIVQFVVKDGRTVLGIEREKNALIRFGFDSESRLSGVAVYFKGDEFPTVLAKLNTHFGPNVAPKQSNYVVIEWPKENGVIVSLVFAPSVFSSDTALNIGYEGLAKPEASKEDLGF